MLKIKFILEIFTAKIKITHANTDIFKHQGFLKYFKNTSWLFFERIFRMTINLFCFCMGC